MATPKKLTKKALVAAHDNINEVVGIEPPIKEDLKQDAYEQELYETIVQLELTDEEIGELDKAAQGVVASLKEKYGDEEEVPDEEEEDEEAEEVEEDDDDDDEEEEEEEEEPAPKKKARAKKPAPVKKTKKVKEPEPEEDEDEEEEEEEPAPKPKRKPAGKKAKKVEAPEPDEDDDEEEEEEEAPKKKAKKVKTPKEKGKLGVIAFIAKTIEDAGDKGVTRDEIFEKLCAYYPERPSAGMFITVKAQISNRMSGLY